MVFQYPLFNKEVRNLLHNNRNILGKGWVER